MYDFWPFQDVEHDKPPHVKLLEVLWETVLVVEQVWDSQAF